MIHGHTVTWLPEHVCLVDPTARQYEEIADYREGPVIALAGQPHALPNRGRPGGPGWSCSPRASPILGGVSGKYSWVSTLVAPPRCRPRGSRAEWGLAGCCLVGVAEELTTTAGAVVWQVAVAVLAQRRAGVGNGDQ
jgi:hypothetical protein